MERSTGRLLTALICSLLPILVPSSARPADDTDAEVCPAQLAGIWRLRASELSIWAPSYAIVKTLGTVSWKVTIGDDGSLAVAEHVPTFYSDPGADPAALPFEALTISRLRCAADRVSVRIERGPFAFEDFELTHFAENAVHGSYRVNDPYLGDPGTGPDYSGRIALERLR